MKISEKISLGLAATFVIFGAVCAANPGGAITNLVRGSQQTAQATDPLKDPSPTPSDTSTTPESQPDSSPFVASEETVSTSTESSPTVVKTSPKPVYGNCRSYSDGSTYTCEIPQQQPQLAQASQPAPEPTPTLTDEERHDITVPNNNPPQDPTPDPTPVTNPDGQ